MSRRIDRVPPPPAVAAPGLFRWFTDLRQALALEVSQAPALLNGWANVDGQSTVHNPVGYHRRGALVGLAGVVSGGTAGSAIFTLPAGFAPRYRQVHPVLTGSSAALGEINIESDGQVVFVSGDPARVSLDGIFFSVE